MREGLPAAKYSVECLNVELSLLNDAYDIVVKNQRIVDDARSDLAKAEAAYRKLMYDFSTSANSVVENLELEIENGKPSMWGGPVKIAITEGAGI
jgi:hypothetical protein